VASLPGLGLLFLWEIGFGGIKGLLDRINEFNRMGSQQRSGTRAGSSSVALGPCTAHRP
jgi:hypothetical protein